MAKVKPERSEVMHDEVLTERIDQLLRLSNQMGHEIQRERRKSGIAYRVDWSPPNINRFIAEDLRIALEDEIVPASVEEDTGTGISDRERNREVIKKALIGLKLATLRDIARDRRLPAGGSIEDVATQIGAAYHWDEEAVARLVLDFVAEPVEVHGHSSHLYGLESTIDLASTRQKLEYVKGHDGSSSKTCNSKKNKSSSEETSGPTALVSETVASHRPSRRMPLRLQHAQSFLGIVRSWRSRQRHLWQLRQRWTHLRLH